MKPKPEGPNYGNYESPDKPAGWLARLLPSLAFYSRVTKIVLWSSNRARKGNYSDSDWVFASQSIQDTFEKAGCHVSIKGTEHIAGLDGPAVIIGNHMSTAETFLLPSILAPFRMITYVVKQSLMEYPIFKHIMRSRNPIVVGRTNPREDLKAVIGGGQERLKNGLSVIIFPQKTRSVVFDRESFNTIGVKLAKRAGVPVIPLALKTNAWSNGKLLKDYGRFRPEEKVMIEFGPPIRVESNDREVHQAVGDFIEERLRKWGVPIA